MFFFRASFRPDQSLVVSRFESREGLPLVAGGGAISATPPEKETSPPNPGRGSSVFETLELESLPGFDVLLRFPVVSQTPLNHRLQAAIPPGFKVRHYPIP
jgi:hypothetical protein